ncbi:MAG: NADH-quinone oxidoreductase subunit B [Bacteriovoracaceae bacterium]|jgi:NADH-quinone oxidoreductase subunit B
MNKDNKNNQDILSDVAMVVDAKSFLERWSTSLKADQLWPFPVSFSCCSTELRGFKGKHFDPSILELHEYFREPDKADLLVLGGTITHKMAPRLKEIYRQMPEGKMVMAIGACASSGGPYWTYSVVQGVSQLFPVDIYLPGCPPTPESIVEAFTLIEERIEKRVSAVSQINWSLNV